MTQQPAITEERRDDNEILIIMMLAIHKRFTTIIVTIGITAMVRVMGIIAIMRLISIISMVFHISLPLRRSTGRALAPIAALRRRRQMR